MITYKFFGIEIQYYRDKSKRPMWSKVNGRYIPKEVRL